jgi:hypothetical protein
MRGALRTVGIAALGAGLALGAFAADELPPPLYALKQSVPTIGSNIPRRVVTGSQVPINRRYGELTREEQDIVKSRYEAMMPLDEPPYPINGLVPVFEAVHEIQRKVLAQGDLSMFVDVDSQGQATSVSVMKSPDPTLTRAVAQVLMLTKYKPAVCGGKPCSMGYPFRMSFAVEH